MDAIYGTDQQWEGEPPCWKLDTDLWILAFYAAYSIQSELTFNKQVYLEMYIVVVPWSQPMSWLVAACQKHKL